MVAGEQQARAAQAGKEIQPAAEKPQGMADIAGQNEAVGRLVAHPRGKCDVGGARAAG
jgi:hypothetical protein